MTNQELLDILGGVRDDYIMQTQAIRSGGKTKIRSPRKRMLLIAAVISLLLLLAGCAIVYVSLFGSPAEMIQGLYGKEQHYPSSEATDPQKPGASWTVPGYEKQPVEETVAQELERWVSPVGQTIASHGYRLTVDAFLYDHVTHSGLITMLLEHSSTLTNEDFGVDYDGRICNLHGSYLNFSQYGWPYIIPEKTTDTQLAFTFYFQLDQRRGDSLIVSFADFEEIEEMEELEILRSQQIPIIRQRLMQELTPEEAAVRCLEECGFYGYNEQYDDYYFLAANEFDHAHTADYNDTELGQITENLKAELLPEEAIARVKEQWGEVLFEETFRDSEQEELAEIAYSVLAERIYEQTHTENTVCISLPEQMQLPYQTFGNGEVLVNSLCVQINSDRICEEGDSPDAVILHFTDGSSFVVLNDAIKNTLFNKGIENGGVLYMLNSAVNIDDLQSVEIAEDSTSEILEADT